MQPNEPNDREGRDAAEAQAHEQEPLSEADAIGYDDPSVSPVVALREADAIDDQHDGE